MTEAFPRTAFNAFGFPLINVEGMSQRQFYAAVAMHALIPIIENRIARDATNLVDWTILKTYAFGIADEFLNEP